LDEKELSDKGLGKKAQSQFEMKRRQMLGCMCALGAGFPLLDAAAQDAAAMTPPQVDDLLGHAFGDKAGQPIAADELAIDTKQVFAFAIDPATGNLRNGTRMNQVVLVRLDPATLSADTAARSVNGLVAYSGICSHTGCDVTDWNSEFKRFQCPCHESQFDPGDGARVVGGPAPWQLAALPLKEIDGKVAVAAEFEGRLGFMQPGQNPFGI
jgi:rieske iron-sulfur protein